MKHIVLSAAVALAGFTGLAACSGDTAADAPRVEISSAYIKPPLAGRDIAAGYFDAQAIGADAALIGASSPVATRVEIHTHTMDGGVMRMRKVDRVELPAGETVRFEPAGYHLMMFGTDFGDATDANVTLSYADGQTVTLSVPVGEP